MLSERIKVQSAEGTWVVRAGGAVIGESSRALELLEEGFAPVIYFPREDLGMPFLDVTTSTTTCPWIGVATFYSIVTKSSVITDGAWSYETPNEGAQRLAGHIAFYPNRVTIEQI